MRERHEKDCVIHSEYYYRFLALERPTELLALIPRLRNRDFLGQALDWLGYVAKSNEAAMTLLLSYASHRAPVVRDGVLNGLERCYGVGDRIPPEVQVYLKRIARYDREPRRRQFSATLLGWKGKRFLFENLGTGKTFRIRSEGTK